MSEDLAYATALLREDDALKARMDEFLTRVGKLPGSEQRYQIERWVLDEVKKEPTRGLVALNA